MSETNKNHVKRPPFPSMVALLAVLISGQTNPATGQDLSTYGAGMCAEVGIPADQCSLSAPPDSSEASSAADKTATLVEHGRRVCAQEGVPLEDCRALPSSYRKPDETILPASSFLTVPDRIPAPDPGLAPVPVPVMADAPIPARQQGMRYARPPAPSAEPPLRYARPPPVGPGYRYAGPPSPSVDAGFRYVEPPLPPIGTGFRYAAPPPPSAGPVFRYIEPPLPLAERPARVGWQGRLSGPERVREPERFRRRERFRGDAPSGRCLRAVRYSRPPSYRYVTC